MKILPNGHAEMSEKELQDCWNKGQLLAEKLSVLMRDHYDASGLTRDRFQDAAIGIQIDFNAACILMASVISRFADDATRHNRFELAGEMIKSTVHMMTDMIERGIIETKRMQPAREH